MNSIGAPEFSGEMKMYYIECELKNRCYLDTSRHCTTGI